MYICMHFETTWAQLMFILESLADTFLNSPSNYILICRMSSLQKYHHDKAGDKTTSLKYNLKSIKPGGRLHSERMVHWTTLTTKHCVLLIFTRLDASEVCGDIWAAPTM